jgi:hypothetical protein
VQGSDLGLARSGLADYRDQLVLSGGELAFGLHDLCLGGGCRGKHVTLRRSTNKASGSLKAPLTVPSNVGTPFLEQRATLVFLTLGEAAKQSGFAKSTLSRAIRDGKLSAQKSAETASLKIDPAELHRYCEAMQVVRNRAETEPEKHATTPSKDSEKQAGTPFETRLQEVRERAELEARARIAEERVADMKAQMEELRRQRDAWQEQAERLALAPPKPEARRWWPWGRLG